jgi:hypothetical protein
VRRRDEFVAGRTPLHVTEGFPGLGAQIQPMREFVAGKFK